MQVAQTFTGHPSAWAVLYRLSMEDAHLPAFTKALPLVFRHLLATPDLQSTPALHALAVNLTQHRWLAQVPVQAVQSNHCRSI